MPKLPIMKSILQQSKSFLLSQTPEHKRSITQGFTQAKKPTDLFPATNPQVDGEECLHDCDSCSVHLPRKWSIDEDDELYGFVKGWSTHLVVATAKTDWVRDVTEEKGSVMEALGKVGLDAPRNGQIMLSASDMPVDDKHDREGGYGDGKTRCLLLPAWTMVEDVYPADVKDLVKEVVERAPTNSTALGGVAPELIKKKQEEETEKEQGQGQEKKVENGTQIPDVSGLHVNGEATTLSETAPPVPAPSRFKTHSCPHRAVILMCSHKTRDARCGQSAPLLRKEFERILRPMGLYRDIHDERPGGIGIYFINHVGGHKYSANIMVYRRQGRKVENSDEDTDGSPLTKEAVQCIWLARVRPEDCENIVRYTVLQGKVVKPNRQLRGGFDRERGLVSW